jgi:hypothetical protein
LSISSSKTCKTLLGIGVSAIIANMDVTLLTRLKIVSSSGTRYLPNENGYYLNNPRYDSSPSHATGHYSISDLLETGTNTITLQCARSTSDGAIQVIGEEANWATGFSIITIGSVITEL